MAETMILIPGRSNKQGTSLNKGKLKEEYLEVTSTVEMNPADMERLGVADGDSLKLSTQVGDAIVRCVGKKPDELPEGVMFIAYGPSSTELMGSDTAGTGMPLSKNFTVEVESVKA
jgi:formylmethanofuran dehydrogenase subunit D